MMDAMKLFLDCSLSLIVLINPLSKLFVVSTFFEESSMPTIRRICIKAAFIAAIILLGFTLIGNPLLKHVFGVHIYSLKIIGGLVLVLRGFQALNKGLFFEVDSHDKLEDLSIVPLASPMIAGPATITASVSFPIQYGVPITALSIVVAVIITLIFMLSSRLVGGMLIKYNLMGALIRITGLVVATIGTQLMLNGIASYMSVLRVAV